MVYWLNEDPEWLKRHGLFTEAHWTPLDGDLKKIKLADTTPDGGLDQGIFESGRALATEHVPTRWRYHASPRPPLRDLGHLWNGSYVVSPAFRDIVEAHDPGVHQFHPMEVIARGKTIGMRYWMIVCNRTDALSDADCIPPIHPDSRGYRASIYPAWTPRVPDWRLAFDAARLAGVHLFVERRYRGTCVSATLGKALTEAGMQGMRLSNKRIVVVG